MVLALITFPFSEWSDTTLEITSSISTVNGRYCDICHGQTETDDHDHYRGECRRIDRKAALVDGIDQTGTFDEERASEDHDEYSTETAVQHVGRIGGEMLQFPHEKRFLNTPLLYGLFHIYRLIRGILIGRDADKGFGQDVVAERKERCGDGGEDQERHDLSGCGKPELIEEIEPVSHRVSDFIHVVDEARHDIGQP